MTGPLVVTTQTSTSQPTTGGLATSGLLYPSLVTAIRPAKSERSGACRCVVTSRDASRYVEPPRCDCTFRFNSHRFDKPSRLHPCPFISLQCDGPIPVDSASCLHGTTGHDGSTRADTQHSDESCPVVFCPDGTKRQDSPSRYSLPLHWSLPYDGPRPVTSRQVMSRGLPMPCQFHLCRCDRPLRTEPHHLRATDRTVTVSCATHQSDLSRRSSPKQNRSE